MGDGVCLGVLGVKERQMGKRQMKWVKGKEVKEDVTTGFWTVKQSDG